MRRLRFVLTFTILAFSSICLMPTVKATESVTLNPIADSYIALHEPDVNYGAASYLKVWKWHTSQAYRAYLKFDLTSIPSDATIISARLKLFLMYVTGDATSNVAVHFCSDNTWTEIGITWNNAPSFEPTATYITAVPYEETWYSWIITEDVNRTRPNHQLSLVLVSTSTTIVSFVSKDPEHWSMYKPKLIVTYTVPDTTPPTISNVDASPVTGKSGTVFTISADVDDPSGVGSVVSCIQKPDESDVYTVTLTDPDSDGTYTGEWNSTDADDGIHYVDIVASDAVGNEGEKENSITFRVDNVSPSLSNVEHQPVKPTPNDKVTITCKVTDESGVKKVYLHYSVDEDVSWNKVLMTFTGNSIYEVIIQKQSEGTTVQYYIEVFDNAGNSKVSDTYSYDVKLTKTLPLWTLLTGTFIVFGMLVVAIIYLKSKRKARRRDITDEHLIVKFLSF